MMHGCEREWAGAMGCWVGNGSIAGVMAGAGGRVRDAGQQALRPLSRGHCHAAHSSHSKRVDAEVQSLWQDRKRVKRRKQVAQRRRCATRA